MAGPCREAPLPTPSRRHGSRVVRLVRVFLPCRDEHPHDRDPSAISEDKTPVHVGGVWATSDNIISAVCGDTNPDVYLLFTKGGDGVPIARVLLQVTMCPRS